MSEELLTVPHDADDDFDPGYEPVEDPNHGESEHEEVSDEEVKNYG